MSHDLHHPAAQADGIDGHVVQVREHGRQYLIFDHADP
jgi:sRNA-binding regulator protein Hfq